MHPIVNELDTNCIIKQGYLTKSPPMKESTSLIRKRWHMRWVILYDTSAKGSIDPISERNVSLIYYKTDAKASTMGNPRGRIPLLGAQVTKYPGRLHGFPYVINIRTNNNKLYHLCATQVSVRDDWIKKIRKHILPPSVHGGKYMIGQIRKWFNDNDDEDSSGSSFDDEKENNLPIIPSKCDCNKHGVSSSAIRCMTISDFSSNNIERAIEQSKLRMPLRSRSRNAFSESDVVQAPSIAQESNEISCSDENSGNTFLSSSWPLYEKPDAIPEEVEEEEVVSCPTCEKNSVLDEYSNTVIQNGEIRNDVDDNDITTPSSPIEIPMTLAKLMNVDVSRFSSYQESSYLRDFVGPKLSSSKRSSCVSSSSLPRTKSLGDLATRCVVGGGLNCVVTRVCSV